MGQNAGNPISLAEWKASARRGEAPPPDVVLFKQYIADSIKAEGDGKTYTFTISTQAVDRDKDTLAVDGWTTANFLKAGGPVLWAHQSRDLPIGKSPWVKAQAGALKARMEFAPADTYAFADTVRRLVDFGALKATSVGFLPDYAKAAWNEERGGVDFKGQDLLEFSIVPVPSNTDALLDAKAAGIGLAPLMDWAERVLDGASGPGLWVPKEQAAAALKALTGPRVVVPATFGKVLSAVAEKSGRTLSAANVSRISSALTSIEDSAEGIGAAVEALEEVLELATPAQGDEPDAKAADPVLFLEKEPFYVIDPSDVAAAVRAAVSEKVREAVNAATGRLD